MENHDEKFDFLAENQNYKCGLNCPGCTRRNIENASRFDLQLDHIHPRCREGKMFIWQNENLREFIDSLINLRVLRSECHINGAGSGKRYSDKEALIFESILRSETFGAWTYGDVVNMRSDLSFVDIQSVVEDVMTIFKSITEVK